MWRKPSDNISRRLSPPALAVRTRLQQKKVPYLARKGTQRRAKLHQVIPNKAHHLMLYCPHEQMPSWDNEIATERPDRFDTTNILSNKWTFHIRMIAEHMRL
jgi:hypothetical protein